MASTKVWKRGQMEALNNKDCRITIDGRRHYTTPFGPAPSVTTILSEIASEANKKS